MIHHEYPKILWIRRMHLDGKFPFDFARAVNPEQEEELRAEGYVDVEQVDSPAEQLRWAVRRAVAEETIRQRVERDEAEWRAEKRAVAKAREQLQRARQQ